MHHNPTTGVLPLLYPQILYKGLVLGGGFMTFGGCFECSKHVLYTSNILTFQKYQKVHPCAETKGEAWTLMMGDGTIETSTRQKCAIRPLLQKLIMCANNLHMNLHKKCTQHVLDWFVENECTIINFPPFFKIIIFKKGEYCGIKYVQTIQKENLGSPNFSKKHTASREITNSSVLTPWLFTRAHCARSLIIFYIFSLTSWKFNSLHYQ